MKSSSSSCRPLQSLSQRLFTFKRTVAVVALAAVTSVAHAVVPMIMQGAADVTDYTNTPWTLQKTGTYTPGSPAGTGVVNWTVTVTKGTTTKSMLVGGYIDLINGTSSAVPLTGVVVNLQRVVGGDFATVSSDIADSIFGDAATTANVDPDLTYEGVPSFSENGASGSLSLTDTANNPFTLNGPVQTIPAHATRRIYFTATFDANVLNIPTGTALQIEVLANFPTSFVMPTLSYLSNTTMPAPVVANGSVTVLDPSITASGTVTTGSFSGLNQVLTQSGSFPLGVTVTSGVHGGTVCNTATLTSSSTTIPLVVNNVTLPSITIPGINLTKTDCQDVPPPPGGPKLTVDSVTSCSQVVTYDTTLFTSTNGPIVSATFNPPSGSTFPFGTTPVSYTATDSAGISASGTFLVNVIDSAPPVITPVANITVPATTGTCAANVTYSTTATDCNLASLTFSPVSGSSFPIGTSTVTITATDTAGHSSTSTFTVTVTDVVAPVVHTSNIQVNVTPGTCSANVNFAATADDCTSTAFIYSLSSTFSPAIVSGASFPIGTTTVYVKATDSSGNSSTGSFTVTVVDNEAPVITPVANITVGNDQGKCSAVVSYSTTANDCQLASLTFSPASGSEFPIGTTTVTITATDVSGNQSTKTFTVTVKDTEAPVVHVANIVMDSTPGTCGADVTFAATADDCSAVTFAYSLNATYSPAISSGAHFPLGTTTVYVKATDAQGNVSTATFTVTVVDIDAPVIVPIADINVPTDSGKCTAKVTFSTTATDCNLQSVTYSPASGTDFPIGTTTVFITATDTSGHETSSSFTVTVNDATAPILHVSNVVVNDANGDCGANADFSASADDCTQVSIVYSLSPSFDTVVTSGASFPSGTTIVYVKATDTSGNSSTGSFTVTVTDTTAPVLTVGDVTVNNIPGTCAALVTFAATADDCSQVTLTYSLNATFTAPVVSGASFPIGTTKVYVKATDASGNVATSSFNVIVLDTDAPVLTVSNVTVNNMPGVCNANVNFSATANDCSGATIIYSLNSTFSPTISSGANFPLGTTVVYVKATDGAGNIATGSFTVTVKDAEAPVLHLTNITTTSIIGNCGASVAFAAAADDCSSVTFIYSLSSTFSSTIASGYNFPVGTTTVYVKATDAAGNTSTGTFTVTVNPGGISLTISNITTNVIPGTCAANVTFNATTTSCSSVTVIYSLSSTFSPTIPSTSSFPVGTTTVYAKATDTSGKTATTSFTVTVVDNQAPVITAPSITTSVTPGTCTANVAFNVTTVDCKPVTLTYSLSSTFSPTIASGASFPIGTTTVYVKATDSNGNVSTKTFTVTVVDNQAPVITAPNITVNNDLNTCGAKVTFTATATDCSAYTLVYSLSSTCSPTISSGTTFPVGTTAVYVKATDAFGNTSTKSFTVTVKDAQAPTITSPLTNLNLQVDCGKCYATFCYTPKATDNCAGAVTVTVSPASGTHLAAGTTTTITVTATDSAGNSISKTFTVKVGACPPTQTTYTQGGWGTCPAGNNPGTLLAKYFSYVYPSGLTVGGTYTVKFTSASAIANALPLTGTPAALTKSYTNPTSGNTFESQVIALKLNVDFSAKGLMPINQGSLGNMKVVSGKLAGYTVTQVLALCNKVLGGTTSALPSGVSISDLTSICDSINGNFDNGTVNLGYLTY